MERGNSSASLALSVCNLSPGQMLKLQDAIGRELCTHPQSQSNVDRGDVLSLIRIQSLERTPGYPDQKSGTRPDKFVRDRDMHIARAYAVIIAPPRCLPGRQP